MPIPTTTHVSRTPVHVKTPLKRTNDIPLTSEYLLVVLGDLSTRIQIYFGTMAPLDLVVHGGAVMVLHKGLNSREYTLDIDYCHRAFVTEWTKKGLRDAEARLQTCIKETAERFNLGADWMNAHADVALPYGENPTTKETWDPAWHAAMTPQNVKDNTVYSSPYLRLIAVPWSWAVAFKLVRYAKYDPFDIACILARGRKIQAVGQWDLPCVEQWLRDCCAYMGYCSYSPRRLQVMRTRIQHAITVSHQVEQSQAQALQLYHQKATAPVMTTAPHWVRVG